jgi:hypothetical protein
VDRGSKGAALSSFVLVHQSELYISSAAKWHCKLLVSARPRWAVRAERNQIVCSGFLKGVLSKGSLKLLRAQKSTAGRRHKSKFDARLTIQKKVEKRSSGMRHALMNWRRHLHRLWGASSRPSKRRWLASRDCRTHRQYEIL